MKRRRVGKIKAVFTIVTIVVGGVVVSGIIIGRILQPKLGLLSIETNPNAAVYIDGKQVGHTPYEEEIRAADILLRLVPEGEESAPPYETTLTISPGVKTIVRRTFGSSVEDSSGVIVSFDKTSVNEAGLAIISEPDNANVLVDTNLHTTPLKIDSISPGPHQVIINKFGYGELSLEIQAELNYIVTLEADLATLDTVVDIGSMGPEAVEGKEFAHIIGTPAGFLRVRSEPSVASSEIGKINEGGRVEILGKSEDAQWLKIAVSEDGSEGWISSLYASPSGEIR